MQRPCIVFLALLLLPGPGRAQAPTPTTEPPVANRVEPFSGAVGRKFTVTTHIEPTEIQVGDTLRFTVQVVADGPWQRPPQRPELRRHEKYHRFAQQFHIENADERHDKDKALWEFDYRLRPLHESVTEVPRLPFVYYKPDSGYQTTGAPAVKLTVRPREIVSPTQVQGSVELTAIPERLYQFQEGVEVLRHEEDFVQPSEVLILLFFLGIPLFCVGWYVAWKRLYPEAARLVQIRKSQAARAALHALRRVPRADPEALVQQCCHILAGYLHQRFDLTPAEPTPAEIIAHLQSRGIGADLADRAAAVFRVADAVRFAGDPPDNSQIWIERISQLIYTLETAACPPPVS